MARSCLVLVVGAVLASGPVSAAAQKLSLGAVQSPSLQPGEAQRLAAALGDAARGALGEARLSAGPDAGLTLTSDVARFGENLVLTLRLIDLKTGEELGSRQARGAGFEQLLSAASASCAQLLAPLAGAPAAPLAAIGNGPARLLRDTGGLSVPVFAGGCAALAGGLALDAFAASSHDHVGSAADFIPPVLYLAGTVAVLWAASR